MKNLRGIARCVHARLEALRDEGQGPLMAALMVAQEWHLGRPPWLTLEVSGPALPN
jgi:hypothetical protein